MNDQIMQARDLRKTYNVPNKPPKHALSAFSLDVKRGETLAIIGPNGAGKSTFIKCLAGLSSLDAGTIDLTFDTRPGLQQTVSPSAPDLLPTIRERIAVVLQEPGLWPHFTVIQNVARPLTDTRHIAKTAAESRAKDYLVKLGVEEDQWTSYPHTLSPGYRRRVAIARALATEPELLILDEVTAHIDPQAVAELMGLLEDDFIKVASKTVIMVTHRTELLSAYASRVVVLLGGSVANQGSPKAVLDNPNTATNEFIQTITAASRNERTFASTCLEESIAITSLALGNTASVTTGSNDGEPSNVFQGLCQQVSHLLRKLDSEAPHLVLIVTQAEQKGAALMLRGARVGPGFRFNGANASNLGKIIDTEHPQVVIDECGNTKETVFHTVVDLDTVIGLDGAPFLVGPGPSSLIELIIRGQLHCRYRYAETFSEIEGVHNTSVPIPDTHPQERLSYCEFSTRTRNVYLFPMKVRNDSVGVLSIDTYSARSWNPFVIEQMKHIATLGAIAIKIMRSKVPQDGN